jgi:hypothetical protein
VYAVSYPKKKTIAEGTIMKHEEIKIYIFLKNGTSRLNLQKRATISYPGFQKFVDPQGIISDFGWFKYHNLFLGMQDEAQNLLFYREA